jgi:hypothetical protein
MMAASHIRAMKEMPVLKGRKNPRCALFIGVSGYQVQDGEKYANLSRLLAFL